MKVVRLSVLLTGHFTLQEIILVLISVKGLATVRAEGIEPSAFRLVAQCNNQVRHRKAF